MKKKKKACETLRIINKDIEESRKILSEIKKQCHANKKQIAILESKIKCAGQQTAAGVN